MNQDEALAVFKESGAYLDGHFLLTSGLHSGGYVEKFAALQHPRHCEKLCAGLAASFAADAPDLVVGPAVGGILLAYETARALGTRGIFLEREEGRLTLRRGFSIGPRERVLVVEDVVTTGKSVFEVLEALSKEKAEGRIVGVASLVDRSGGKADFGVPFKPLLKLDLPAWRPEECPLCAKGLALTKRGSRKA